MSDNPYGLDFLQQVININFEGNTAWLLLNVDIAGGNTTPTPPPFGTFSSAPPKGTKLLDQKTISKTQHGGTVDNKFFFPWYTLGAVPPDLTNYRTVQPGHGGSLLFAWSVTDTLRGFPDDPSFPPPDKEFWYSTAAKAAQAATFLQPPISAGNGQDGSFFASLPNFLANSFSTTITFPMLYSVQVVNDPTAGSVTDFNVKFLFAVPEARSLLPFTVGVPSGSSAVGWASIFTSNKTRKTVKKISDLTGLADQSVPSFGSTSSHTFRISTTGKPGQGTVSVDGVLGTIPGLAPNAPLPGAG